MSSTHRSMQQGDLLFPSSTGDRDFSVEFATPGLTDDFRRDRRPYISYQADPSSDERVRVEMSINQTPVVAQTFLSPQSRTMTQIFEHGVLNETSPNELIVTVPNSEPGSVTVSQIVLVYSESPA